MANSRVRTAYFVSTMSVALVLFLVGSIAYVIMNIEKAASDLIEQVHISAILEDDLSTGAIDSLRNQVATLEGVRDVAYTTKEQAAEEFKTFIGSDFTLIVDENPLPASLEIAFNESVDEASIMASVVDKLEGMNGISQVLAQENVIAQVLENIYRFKLIMFAFGGCLLLVSIILIRNTIRIAILSKRFIIKTMTLVGATDSFIRRPFVRSAFYQGVAAAMIAICALGAIVVALKRSLPEVELIIDDWQRIAMLLGGMLALGVLLCVVSTIMSVNKFIRLDNNNLYIY